MSKLCVPGAKIIDICEQGDKLMEEELSKVYRDKKTNKGALTLDSGRLSGFFFFFFLDSVSCDPKVCQGGN